MCRLALLLLAAALPIQADANPIAQVVIGKVKITLHTTECKLKGEIINLPRRVVWLEDGKETEGCWGMLAQHPILSFYFADKTVTAIPAQMFERITST